MKTISRSGSLRAAAVVRAGAALAATGLGAGLLIDSAPASLIGWMALGL
ncbi:hypothetical protein [Streptomyces avermitilis]|uniref:Uncharacterized protein n=1 Tax=Streptomyces avermitilis TaxID=33903 RepID=A0A4D4MCS4_STRAX|nr:hypothetical protein SAV14893_090380 [Streptomyces avermitilis]